MSLLVTWRHLLILSLSLSYLSLSLSVSCAVHVRLPALLPVQLSHHLSHHLSSPIPQIINSAVLHPPISAESYSFYHIMMNGVLLSLTPFSLRLMQT